MKIQNMIKKIMIAVLSAAMMLAPIVNIKAASTDVVDTSKTGSITIHKYDMTAAKQAGVNTSQFTPTGKQDAAAEAALEKYAIKGAEFSYLRVGDVEQQSENGKIQMIYELPTTIQQILGLTSSDAAKTEGSKTYFTSQQINEKLAKALEDNTVTKDKLEDYMGKNGTAMDETNANGVTSKDKLPLGLYLIVETKAPENVTYTINPWFVQLPSTDSKGDDWFYDVICYPKNETGNPTLDKRVRNNPDQDNVTTANTDRLADFTSARNEYKYQSGKPLKYPALKPPDAKGYFRFHKLGEGYTLEEIRARILRNIYKQPPFPELVHHLPQHYRVRGKPQKKVTGLRALYFRYCYELHIIVKRPASVKRVSFLLREDIAKLDRLDAETRFLGKHHIGTMEELTTHWEAALVEVEALTAQRQELRKELRRCSRQGDAIAADEVKQRISALSGRIRAARKEVVLCDGIAQRSGQVRENLGRLVKQREIERKEQLKNELFRRRGGASREDVAGNR